MRRIFADLSPLRASPAYRRLFVGTSLANIGASITAVAVGLQVYHDTGSTFSVGLVGLFAVVPLIVLGLYGGALVDAHDRRIIAIVTAVGMFIAAGAITVQAFAQVHNQWLVYALVALQSGCYAVNSPARSAIVPRLLTADLLPAANALSGLTMGLGFMLGPLLAGYLVAWVGFGWTYLIEAVMLLIALTTLVRLPPLPPTGEVRRAGLGSVLEGLSFLRGRANVRMTFMLDLAAMICAMPRVLFPALGAIYLGGGARTVGLLGAALAIGSVAAGVFSGPLGRVRRQGLAVIVAVVCWGVMISAFGVIVLGAEPPRGSAASAAIWPAAAALGLAGAADQVSAVFRMTILQAATPDGMRGRLQGVFTIVVAGGPRLADIGLGTVATLIGEPWAAIAGGLACAVVALALAVRWRGFARYDAAHPVP